METKMTKIIRLCVVAVATTLLLSACSAAETPKIITVMAPENSVEINEAIAQYEKLVLDNASEIEAVLGLARNLRWAGRIDDAAHVLNTAPATFANAPRFRAEQGKVRLIQGESVQGLGLLELAALGGAQGNANDWRLYSAIGIGNDYVERYGDAEIAYRKALELSRMMLAC